MELQAHFNLIPKSGFTDKILKCLIKNNASVLFNDGVDIGVVATQDEDGDLTLNSSIKFVEINDESNIYKLCQSLIDIEGVTGIVVVKGVPLEDISFDLKDFKSNLSEDFYNPKHSASSAKINSLLEDVITQETFVSGFKNYSKYVMRDDYSTYCEVVKATYYLTQQQAIDVSTEVTKLYGTDCIQTINREKESVLMQKLLNETKGQLSKEDLETIIESVDVNNNYEVILTDNLELVSHYFTEYDRIKHWLNSIIGTEEVIEVIVGSGTPGVSNDIMFMTGSYVDRGDHTKKSPKFNIEDKLVFIKTKTTIDQTTVSNVRENKYTLYIYLPR